MPKLSLVNISKKYHGGVKALDNFSLEIKDHEFVVILGKSGCGKTTLLRMISGLDHPDSGEMWMDDILINDVDPIDRETAMVFQNYALYPQMTVYQNLSIPLRTKLVRKQIFDKNGNPVLSPDEEKISELKLQISELSRSKEDKKIKQVLKSQIKELKLNPTEPTYEMVHLTKEEIDKKIKYVANELGITPFLYQNANTLSGGQKQRVALGKAMVREPKILLMDEPLSNVDAKSRSQALTLIQKVHNKCHATTIYVTHDQNESVTLADKLVIMNNGRIEQEGDPYDVILEPKNLTVARFIGNPPTNIIPAVFVNNSLRIDLEDETLIIPTERLFNKKEILIGIRPEKLFYNPIKNGLKMAIKCDYCELLGHDTYCYAFIGEERIAVKLPNKVKIEPDTKFDVYFDAKSLLYFDKETGGRIY